MRSQRNDRILLEDVWDELNDKLQFMIMNYGSINKTSKATSISYGTICRIVNKDTKFITIETKNKINEEYDNTKLKFYDSIEGKYDIELSEKDLIKLENLRKNRLELYKKEQEILARETEKKRQKALISNKTHFKGLRVGEYYTIKKMYWSGTYKKMMVEHTIKGKVLKEYPNCYLIKGKNYNESIAKHDLYTPEYEVIKGNETGRKR